MTLFTTSRPTISVKSVTRYPTRITTGTGLSYTYTNGTLNISLDYSDIPDSAQIADPANYTTIVYNKTTGLLEEVQLDYIPTTVVTDPVYTRGDSNFTIPSDYRVLSLVANLTASRTWTLPLAADVTSGNRIFIYDTVGGISATNTLVIAAPSGNTINGASSITLSNAFAGITIVSNSGTQWTAILTNVDSVGGLGTNVANAMKQPVNAASGLVRLDSSGNVPALNGAALTSLNASNIGSGTVPAARLPGPTLSTIGGVKAKAAETSKFVNQIDTDGSVNLAQPAVSDISGFGTGVATALGVNVGSSGAFVTNGGALGTPSSGTLTNATGLPLATGVTGTLPVANGGTGLTSLAAGYIPYGNGTGAFSSSSGLTFDGTNFLSGTGANAPVIGLNSGAAGGLLLGRISGGNTWLIGDTVAVLGSGTGLTNYVYGANPWIVHTNGSERLRITSDGFVGIGTNSPTATLTLPNNVDATAGGVSLFRFYDVGTGAINGLGTSAGSFDLRSVGNFVFYSGSSNTERLRIASDGSVGIGTSSPSGKLHVVGGRSWFQANSEPFSLYLAYNTSTTGMFVGANSTGGFQVSASSGASLLTVDTSGNLGLGVTPSAWSVFKAMEFGAGAFASISNAEIDIVQNAAYLSGTNWTYKAAAAATMYRQGSGAHSWWNAASGSAGSTISFTPAMTLDASGRLGVGVTSPTATLHVKGGNTNNLKIDNNGEQYTELDFLNNGTAKAYIYWDNTNSNWYFRSLGTLQLASSGGSGATIDASGNLLVNNTNGGSQVNIKNTVSNNTKNSIYVQNSSGTEQFRIYGDGGFATGLDAFSPYNYTSGSSANVVVASNGVLLRSTSSLRYKHDVENAVHGLADVLALRPVTYKSVNDADMIFGGLIAEEVDAAGLTEFVVYDGDGRPDALHYGNMVSLAFKAIQELAAEVAMLKGQING